MTKLPRSPRHGPPLWTTALLAAWTAAGAAAQDEPKVRALRTPDGCRVLLLPTGGPPVVHWVVATPAGVAEDPAGLEGLSHAVARAALAGTRRLGSLDPVREFELARRLEQLELRAGRLERAGRPLPADLRAALADVRRRLSRVVDPMAFERALCEAPGLRVVRHETAEATLLELTTTVGGLGRTAARLLEMRERAALRDVHAHLRQVRAAARSARRVDVLADLRREALALAFLGHPLERLYATVLPAEPLEMAVAGETWARTHHPSRTLHVLVGGFDPDTAQDVLRRVFVETSLPTPTTAALPPLAAGRGERRVTRPPGEPAAMVLGYPIPAGVDPFALRVLVAWLGGADGMLARALRRAGHPSVVLRVRAPHPSRRAGLLLVEVLEPTASQAPATPLGSAVLAALEQAITKGPQPSELVLARGRALAERARAAAGPAALALDLAVRHLLEGVAPKALLEMPSPPDAEAVLELARRLMAPENRISVLREAKR